MTPQQRSDYWHFFNRFQRRQEARYIPAIRRAIEDQVIKYLKERVDNPAARIDPTPMIQVLRRLYLEAGRKFGGNVYHHVRRGQKARMPMGFNDRLISFILRYFETDLLNNVEDIDATTRELIEAALTQGIIEGRSIGDMTDEIVKAVASRVRARLIARTETVTAANFGAMKGAEATGLKLKKVWISAKDNRTRRVPRDSFDHFHMDGIVVRMTEFFIVPGKNGAEQMLQPGDRKNGATAGNICNCRCIVGFEVEGSGA